MGSRAYSFDERELQRRLSELGQRLGEREAEYGPALEEARRRAVALREIVVSALEWFHEAAKASGSPHLEIETSPIRIDDKHVRAVEFELRRGRFVAIVVAKARGEITLVGPFRRGKTEGPCLSFPYGAEHELETALAGFLERFLEEAATP